MCLLNSTYPSFIGKVPALSAAFVVPAAVRLPRSAAARRALLTMLILGGFLALAFLFGGSGARGLRDAGHSGKGDSRKAASGLLESGKHSAAQEAEVDGRVGGRAGRTPA